MKYEGSKIINKPRDLVVSYFLDENSIKEYQDGFVKKEIIKGAPGQVGAESKLYYKYRNQDMILTEVILANNLPESFEAFYHHKHMDNTMKCRFIEISPNKTQYDYEYIYTRISWFLPKLMATFFPGMYRKQGEKWMNQFKEFVEKQ